MRLTVEHIWQLRRAKAIYIKHPDGMTDNDMADLLNCSRATATRYRSELPTYKVSRGKYSMKPSAEDIYEAHVILERYGYELGTGNPHRIRRK